MWTLTDGAWEAHPATAPGKAVPAVPSPGSPELVASVCPPVTQRTREEAQLWARGHFL